MEKLATVYDARRENLRKRLEQRGARTDLAMKLGVTQPFVSHLLRDPAEATARPIHEDLAKQIESLLGMAPGELDLPFVRSAPDWVLVNGALTLVVECATKQNKALDAGLAARAVRAVYEAAPQLGGVASPSTRALVEAILRS